MEIALKKRPEVLNSCTMNKRLQYLIAFLCIIVFASCGSSRKGMENDFYNKHNELKVKAKNGLFSSLHITFGPYTTGEKQSGIDKNIINFASKRAPFHFSLNDNGGNSTAVQAVYTDKSSLEAKRLPAILDTTRTGDIFYAWVRGGSVNALKNWELMIKNPTYAGLASDDQVGVFRSPTELITVHANNRFGTGGSYTNMCFEFKLRGVSIGAVTVNGDNRVWIDRQLDKETRFALAGAIASLMMR